MHRNSCLISIILLFSFSVWGKTDLLVFILSGQSNMAGFAKVSELPANLKNTQENVIINLDAEGDISKRGRWLNSGPGFGTSSSQFGPELTFGKTLADSLPGKTIALIKNAVSGTSLASTSGWRPPSSDGATGTLYTNMMNHIDRAMASLDTSKYTPLFAGFVWLQGEFDAMNSVDADDYESNLTNLIKDIRQKTGVEGLPVIIPMIDAQNIWTHNSKVRAAEIAVTKSLANVDTLDTKGFQTDGIHYKADGQIKIGIIAAKRFLAMKKIPVHAVYRNEKPVFLKSAGNCLFSPFSIDFSGRKIGRLNTHAAGKQGLLPGVFIRLTNKTDGGWSNEVRVLLGN